MDTQLLHKIDHLKDTIATFRPLKRQELRELKEYYRIGLTYTSNAIEGNALTETETKIVLEEGITIGGKQLKDHLEALGHSDAYEHMYALAKRTDIREKDIRDLHKLFYMRIDAKRAGKYRKEQVFITGTDFIPPTAAQVPPLMQALIKETDELKTTLHPVAYAALLHLKLVTIHPFIDGNGRTARLIMNVALLQAGYPITIIPAIARVNYIQSIQKAHTTKDASPFIDFIASMAYESTSEYLRLVKALRPA